MQVPGLKRHCGLDTQSLDSGSHAIIPPSSGLQPLRAPAAVYVPGIYSDRFVRSLFGRMAAGYWVTDWYSLGLIRYWRKRCVRLANIRQGSHVIDLMCGQGHNWRAIMKRTGSPITAVDFSREMLALAAEKHKHLARTGLHLLHEDCTATGLPDACADAIICSFGLKTMTEEKLCLLAVEVKRLLRPGGSFSFVEIGLPRHRAACSLFRLYFRYFVSLLSSLLAPDPAPHRLLHRYAQGENACLTLCRHLKALGLEVHYREFTFGVVGVVWGRKTSST